MTVPTSTGSATSATPAEPTFPPEDLVSPPGEPAYELNAAQRGLWFLQHVDPHSTAYTITRAFRVTGDLEIDRWEEGITAAHRAGFRSTSVLFYGHVETAAERVAHLRRLRHLQEAGGGGFTEFVPIPLPGPAGGVPLVAGRAAIDEHRAMVAVSRLLLSGSIPHIQIPWTRVGRADAAVLLGAGGDDLGGTLLDGRIKPAAGVEHGRELSVTDAAAIAARLFRPFRLRTTDYRTPQHPAPGSGAAE